MIASLHIKAARRGCTTYLKDSYCTTPFKVANITEDKTSNPLHLMLMSSSPGILDGDQYQLKIELEERCELELHTQSYQRLFNMKQSAGQLMEVYLSSNSSFCFLPHPTVPHTAAVFKSINQIYMEDNCSLVFGEILTPGRKLTGEVFRFSKYHNITEVYFRNKLVIKENLLIEPANINIHAIGQLEGYTHQASLIYLHPSTDVSPLSELIDALLKNQTGICFGITAAPVNGLIIRILGNKAEQLHDCLKKITALLPQNSIPKTIAYAD